jgi:hypothetical protein
MNICGLGKGLTICLQQFDNSTDPGGKWGHHLLSASIMVEGKPVSRFNWSEKKETLVENYDEGLSLT